MAEKFHRIARYLSNPLTLVGYALLLFFGIHKTLISSGILPPVSQAASGTIVTLILKYGFMIALASIVCGFALAFWKEHHASKKPVLARLDAEALVQRYRGNIEACLRTGHSKAVFLDFVFTQRSDGGIHISIFEGKDLDAVPQQGPFTE